MKINILLVCVLVIVLCIPVKSACPVTSCPKVGEEQEITLGAMRYQRFIKRVQQSRATVYNALSLTDEQIKAREDLLTENDPFYEQKFEELINESSKLQVLSDARADLTEAFRQKRVVQKIQSEIEQKLEAENNEFKRCLTREQRAKYSMIRKLERDDYKKNFKHKKDYYAANPRMHEFGNPTSTECCAFGKNPK